MSEDLKLAEKWLAELESEDYVALLIDLPNFNPQKTYLLMHIKGKWQWAVEGTFVYEDNLAKTAKALTYASGPEKGNMVIGPRDNIEPKLHTIAFKATRAELTWLESKLVIANLVKPKVVWNMPKIAELYANQIQEWHHSKLSPGQDLVDLAKALFALSLATAIITIGIAWSLNWKAQPSKANALFSRASVYV